MTSHESIQMNPLNPSTTALLVVHLQHDIVSPDTAFGSMFSPEVQSRGILAQCDMAMETVRAAGGLVIPLRIAFAHDYSDLTPSLPLLNMVRQAGCLIDGSEGASIVPEISLAEQDMVVTHQLPGPFSSSSLHDEMSARAIESVVVCGVATNASVEGAVRQAADLGYTTYVLSDAVSAADSESHEASLASMGLFAGVVKVADLTSALSAANLSH
jgi:nicotinamidase-related amidase